MSASHCVSSSRLGGITFMWHLLRKYALNELDPRANIDCLLFLRGMVGTGVLL